MPEAKSISSSTWSQHTSISPGAGTVTLEAGWARRWRPRCAAAGDAEAGNQVGGVAFGTSRVVSVSSDQVRKNGQ